MANYGVTKIEFINEGFRDVLQSEGVKDLLTDVTDQVCADANANYGGDGFKTNVILGGKAQRYLGFVYAFDKESAIAESEDSALTRAIT